MKLLREGYTTGSCATGAVMAVALWKTTGYCPEQVQFTTPIGVELCLDIVRLDGMRCGVVKDAGDDPDVTNDCMVIADVQIKKEIGDIIFCGGDGIGVVTLAGLKLPVGEPAINPVPREMITKELRQIIGDRKAIVTLSIPNGKEIAKHTFNERLGVMGGLSVLGTTGIVRPMSEEAVKDSLSLELKMNYENGKRTVAFVLGNTGEQALKRRYPDIDCIVHMSNYVGFMLDTATDMGFENILIFGQTGKLVKLASDIMNTHSHVADARNETICTHVALMGAKTSVIKELYECRTTQASISVIDKYNLHSVWTSIIKKAQYNCERRVLNKSEIAIIFIDGKEQILSQTDNVEKVLEGFR